MIGDNRARHCAQCNLNVYNLSAMTEREIAQLVAAHQDRRLCTRFFRRADGTILTQNCPWSLRAIARRASRFASAILTAFMSVTLAAAKSKPPRPTCECRQIEHKEPGIRLTVQDPDGAAIPNVQIMLESRSKKQTFSGTTGPSGEWIIRLAPGEYVVTARASGFRPFVGTVAVSQGALLSMKLKLPVGELKQTVEVTSPAVEIVGTYVIVDKTPAPTLAVRASGGQRVPMR